MTHKSEAVCVLGILSTAYHHHSQGSLSHRFPHGRGLETPNCIYTRVKNKDKKLVKSYGRGGDTDWDAVEAAARESVNSIPAPGIPLANRKKRP